MDLLEKFKRYAKLSDLAYNPYLQKDAQIGIHNYTYTVLRRIYSHGTSTEGYILKRNDKNKFVITFSGTKDVKDFLYDIIAWKSNWPKDWTYTDTHNIKFHHGFFNAYSSIRTLLINEIKSIISKYYSNEKISISVCGHSLGGALTSIAALELVELFGDKCRISSYKYNSPRVFNEEGKNIFNEHLEYSYRVVNDKDIVSRMPKINYYQDSKLYRILSDGTVTNYAGSFIIGKISHHPLESLIKKLELVKEIII